MTVGLTNNYGNVWNTTTTPKTASVTVTATDWLAVLIAGRSNATTFTVSGGTGLVWTQQTAISANASAPSTSIYTCPPTSSQTFTISVAQSSTFAWGFIVLQLSGVLGIGAKTSVQDVVSGSEQTSLTTTVANSAILMMLNDRGTGAAPTYVTASAGAFTQPATVSAQGNYAGIYLNAGAVGAKTIGLSSPTGTASTISAVELTPIPGTVVKGKIIANRAALVSAATY
jgi:hypothetical protein